MISLVTASAGTGKTTRLTELLSAAIQSGEVAASEVMATTFTVKAAQELKGRSRGRLIRDGLVAQAEELSAAHIGTVHALGGALLGRFAFELGLSPRMNIMAEADTLDCLREALSDAFTEEPCRTHVQEAAEAFGQSREEWQEVVLDLVTAARANRLGPDDLERDGEKSAHELLAFLDASIGEDLDGGLGAALENAVRQLPEPRFKVDKEASELIRSALQWHQTGRLPWSWWAKLSKIESGKRWQGLLLPLRVQASAFMRHPRLRFHLETFVKGVYRFAARGLERYRSHKSQAGLLDYGDLEERLLEVLEDGRLAASLGEDIRMLLVDEFQDTSPMQLSIFMKLAEACERSVWVGDPKQSIYQFRGADQDLMKACIAGLQSTELDVSYRSTPELITFVAALFQPAFARQGIAWAEMRASRDSIGGTPVSLWGLETQNRAEDWVALAVGIRRLLEEQPEVRPGDVAVLCRRRESCAQVAAALTRLGFDVAWQQPGILRTLEGRVVEAGMRLLFDRFDTLAAATISFIDRPPEQGEEAWLESRIREVVEGKAGTWSDHPRVAALHAARERLDRLSPWEAMETVIDVMDLPTLCLSLPHGAQRLANLEALRGLARQYEERCRMLHLAASPAGLLVWLQRLHHEGRDTGVEASGPQAVRVLTYHGAKGLEWPVVVLAELDHEFADIWRGVTVESSRGVDLADPLAGRETRLWLSPFDRQSVGIPFLDRLRASQTAQRLESRSAQESVRLLYVGFTRARDHLVLASRSKLGVFYATLWLQQILQLPVIPEAGEVEVAGTRAQARWLRASATVGVGEQSPSWFARPDRQPERAAAAVPASSLGPGDDGVAEQVSIGTRLRVGKVERADVLGTAVHAFLAADVDLRSEERMRLAHEILLSYGQDNVLDAEAVVEGADRLYRFLAGRYPEARYGREWPLAFRRDGQEVWGQADLVLEVESGWVVIDYKTFDGPADEAGREFGGQLAAYASALSQATRKPVKDRWVYQVIAGRMVRLGRD